MEQELSQILTRIEGKLPTQMTDRERLIILEERMQNMIKVVATTNHALGEQVSNLHGRIVPLERFRDELTNTKITEKVENTYQFINDFKITYRIMMMAASAIGALVTLFIEPALKSFLSILKVR